MIRRLFNLAASISLFLCLAIVAVWVRSYYQFDKFTFTSTRWVANTHQGPYPYVFFWHDKSAIICIADGDAFFWHDEETQGQFSKTFDVVTRIVREHPAGDHRSHEQLGPDDDDAFLDWYRSQSNTTGITHFSYPAWDGTSIPLTGIPFAVVAALTAVLPAIVLSIWLRRVVAFVAARVIARRRPGFCLACGYDLRASKNRCPECGMPTPSGRRDS